jgi:hypothetical protein
MTPDRISVGSRVQVHVENRGGLTRSRVSPDRSSAAIVLSNVARVATRDDGGNLGTVLGKRKLERAGEMLGAHVVPWWTPPYGPD